MPLLANTQGSMYNGVSQQPPHMRGVDQVEEMYNCYPSIEYGLVRREPLQQPDGSQGTDPIMSSTYENSFSKMIVDGKSVYQLNINNGQPEVVQLEPFYKHLRVGSGITISTGASNYLKAKLNNRFARGQYSTTSIKNTTLIANEAVIPKTYAYSTKVGLGWDKYALVWVKHANAALGIDYSVTINGRTFATGKRDRGIDNKSYGQPLSDIGYGINDNAYPEPPRPKISPRAQAWNSDLHASVDASSQTPVYMSAAGWTAGLWYGNTWMTASDISSANSYAAAKEARRIALDELARARWRRDATEAQQDKLNKWVNQDIKGPVTTLEAASELVGLIRAAGFSVSHFAGDSMFVVYNVTSCSTADSFGNQGITSFYKEINGTELLPAKVNAAYTMLKYKVKQESASDDVAYWVRWNGLLWEESQDDSSFRVDQNTMPIEMRTTFYESGSIASIDIDVKAWDSRLMGDSLTNKGPEFFNRKAIRDIFYYRNRLGFLSDEGISMTESANYSNLWRTTAITTLDSDPIDFIVSTTSSTSLRYTIMNQDKIFILADNVQFVMEGGAVLSPKSVKVQEVSHYIINLDIEPIVTDNKIVFIGGTEKSTIVYEYVYNANFGIAEATSLTAHVPGYILKDVQCLAASNEDDMIFLVASDHRERLQGYFGPSMFRDVLTNEGYINKISEPNLLKAVNGVAYPERKIVYCYKFTESGNQRVQSAWSKWNYRGSVLQVAGARGILYMDIDHEFGGDQTNTTIGTGTWEMTGGWHHTDMNWNMSYDDYINSIQLQRRFAKQALRPPFLEATTGDYEVTASLLDDDKVVQLDYSDFGEYVNRSFVDLGEFVFKDRASKKYTASKTMLKSLYIKSDPGSIHTVLVRDMNTAKEREIGPEKNKQFKGIGLASNYYLQSMDSVNVAGRNEPDGVTFDTINILDTQDIDIEVYGEPTLAGGSLDGAFDTAQIANIGEPTPAQTNNILPNLYGKDIPVMIGGSSDSTRVVLSSFYDNDRDYGFRIHDTIQEARINQRFKLS